MKPQLLTKIISVSASVFAVAGAAALSFALNSTISMLSIDIKAARTAPTTEVNTVEQPVVEEAIIEVAKPVEVPAEKPTPKAAPAKKPAPKPVQKSANELARIRDVEAEKVAFWEAYNKCNELVGLDMGKSKHFTQCFYKVGYHMPPWAVNGHANTNTITIVLDHWVRLINEKYAKICGGAC